MEARRRADRDVGGVLDGRDARRRRPAVRRSTIPTPVAALLLGGVVTVGDTLAADMFGRMKAKAQAAAAARDAEEPATS